MNSKSFIACMCCVCSLYVFTGCNSAANEEIPFSGMSYTDYQSDPNLGAYGYALLPATVTAANNDRLQKFANAFTSNLPNYNNGKGVQADANDIMITYWLVKVPRASNVAFTADNLLQLYDARRAVAMLATINKLESAGPVLIAWQKPFEQLTGEEKEHYLSFDLSGYSDDDMERAIRVWRDMLCTGVSNWNSTGVGLTKFKEQVRNLLQSAGPAIADHLSTK